MPVETDIANGCKLIFEQNKPKEALEIYDSVLLKEPENFNAHYYKCIALHKLYYGSKNWHTEEVLTALKENLTKALEIAKKRCIREKIGLVYYRWFLLYYHLKDYDSANRYLENAKKYGYNDQTLPLWEANLKEKRAGIVKEGQISKDIIKEEVPQGTEQQQQTLKFRTDWYQSPKTVTISLFTANPPKTKDEITIDLKNKNNSAHLTLSYKNPSNTSSEFQYTANLSNPIDVGSFDPAKDIFIGSKKLEITLTKNKAGVTWKTLELQKDQEQQKSSIQPISTTNSTSKTNSVLKYPSSSKKHIDWSKFDLDSDEYENDENAGDANKFFQELYKNSDADTQRAMMKSFIESNGTALNTNWNEVKSETVETVPPDGLEAKKWD
ncbi:related to Protein SGT1 [Saccharomycodes ludwigii]|uniref:Related to Protein SGT1 n=1 Tax=Saccharomycodes ludwigii TaxID=36035 RepID=A0A376BAN9_9ASCO|nr:related to Protein SGT1 [Saccharomycodes ludwigii]